MHLLGSATPDWIDDTISPAIAATGGVIIKLGIEAYRRLRSRKQQDASRDDRVAQSQASPPTRRLRTLRSPSDVHVVAQWGRLSTPAGIFRDTLPRLTARQEADLIERGMPERLVRNGNLDYASLVGGSMADRLRSHCC